MAVQFSDLERKPIEPIVLSIEDGNVRALQRFVSDAPWDDDKIVNKYRSLINDDLGSPNGALIFDETSFVKKGEDSIRVSRQYCGTATKAGGNRENKHCPVVMGVSCLLENHGQRKRGA